MRGIYLGTFLALLVSCGLTEKDKKRAKSAKETIEVAGTWTTKCINRNFLVTSVYQREQLEFSIRNNFEKQIIRHDDEDCKDENFRTTIRGGYEVLGESDKAKHGKDINFTIRSIHITAFTPGMVTTLNDASYCGIDNWQADNERNVTGRDCVGLAVDRGDVLFDVYKIEDERLYLGKTFLGFDEPVKLNLRPNKFDESKVYKRK